MALTEFVCPQCHAKAGSAKAIPAGALVRCPKCSHVFRLGVAEPKAPEPRPVEPRAPAPPPSAATRRPASPPAPAPVPAKITKRPPEPAPEPRRPARYEDDDRRRSRYDEDDDRPEPRRRPRKKKAAGNNAAVMIGAIVGGVVILVVVGVVVAVAVFGGSKDRKQVASSPTTLLPLPLQGGQEVVNPPQNVPPPGGGFGGPGFGGGVVRGGPPAGRPGGGMPGLAGPGPGMAGPTAPGAPRPGDDGVAGGPARPNRPSQPTPPDGGPDGDDGAPADAGDAGAGAVAAIDPAQEIKFLVAPPAAARKVAELRPIPPGGQMDKATVDRVKKATVFIRVETAGGKGSGSGFFAAGAPDMVLTNAHVVGMLKPESAPPKGIEVVLNSGDKDEASFRGEVLAVDRNSDLAVLRIHRTDKSKSAALPEPLAVATAAQLFETQQIYIVGFPFGEDLGKNVTISPSSVTSLRRNPEGELDQVQMGAGSHPGNSGGPVVDAGGNLVGVAVAGIRGTSINFAIPADRVASILDGRLYSLQMREPVLMKSGSYQLAAEVVAIDPLRKISAVALDWWWGDAKDKAPAARGAAPPAAAGVTRQTVAMKSAGADRWSASIALPTKVPANKVLWVQARYSTAAEKDVYAAGVTKEVDSPPERSKATLVFKPNIAGNARVELTSSNQLTFRVAGDSKTLAINIDSVLSEDPLGMTPDGGLGILVSKKGRSDKLAVGLSLDGKEVRRSGQINKAIESAGTMEMEVGMDRAGNVTGAKYKYRAAESDQKFVKNVAEQLVHSLEFASIGLPNSPVNPGHRWMAVRKLPLGPVAGDSQGIPFYLTYTYRGVRRIDNKRYAVVGISGRVDTAAAAAGITGSCSATALVDLSAGRVYKYSGTIDSVFTLHVRDIEESRGAETVQARSRLVLKYSRQ